MLVRNCAFRTWLARFVMDVRDCGDAALKCFGCLNWYHVMTVNGLGV